MVNFLKVIFIFGTCNYSYKLHAELHAYKHLMVNINWTLEEYVFAKCTKTKGKFHGSL